MIQQPQATKVTTQHTVIYQGYTITINGAHELKFSTASKMEFNFRCGKHGVTFSPKSTLKFKEKLEYLIGKVVEADEYAAAALAFKNLYCNLTKTEKITHPYFKYARFQTGYSGDYYNIYWRSSLSPTGVELVGGCTVEEWDSISKATGKINNYYSPTENRK